MFLQKWLPTWLSGEESTCQRRRCRRCRFSPWVGTTPWRRKWQPAPVFLPGKSRGQKEPVGHGPCSHRQLGPTEDTYTCSNRIWQKGQLNCTSFASEASANATESSKARMEFQRRPKLEPGDWTSVYPC